VPYGIAVLHQYEDQPVALSVRLEPAIEARIEEEAHRLGISKSEFVKDAIERVLGLKNPAELLHQVRSNTPLDTSDASEQVSRKVREKLREKHTD
jgi:RHH-type rel operon transcriptional repressor/antitoxin RelB